MNAIIAAARKSRASVIFVCFALSAGPAAADEPLPVYAGANSSNGKVLRLDFDANPPVAVTLNDDANSLVSPRSLVFFKNTCATRLDLLVADTNAGALLAYDGSSGTGRPFCAAGGDCPSRPDGLSISAEGRLAVADTGSGGTVPALWFMDPDGDCPVSGDYAPFAGPPHTSGQFTVDGMSVGGIADTAFAPFPGDQDLYVLTTSPTLLARVQQGAIDVCLESSSPICDLPATAVLPQAYFGSQSPTGISFIPGADAGVLELLMATTGGLVHKLTFEVDGEEVALAGEDLGYLKVGKGPLGVVADVVDGEQIAVVTDRQQGRYFRFRLDSAASPLKHDSVIKSNIQNPQGAAINSVVAAATDCVNDPDNPEVTGCRLGSAVDVHLSVPVEQLDGQVVMADVSIIQRGPPGPFVLPGYDGEFTIPALCRGFPAPGAPNGVIIVADLQSEIAFQPTDTVLVTELAHELLPDVTDCKANAVRVYHRAEDLGPLELSGLHRDKTVVCSNPSRSITPTMSPFVACAGGARLDVQAANGKVSKALQAEAVARLDDLENRVNHLAPGSLQTELLLYLAEARKAVQQGKYFPQGSDQMNLGALAVYGYKLAPDTFSSPSLTYADFLGGFLGMAFFFTEDLALADYLPPEPICSEELELTDAICNPLP